MKKHFVIFLSPGTFVAERTEYPVDSWDVEVAVEMSYSVKERHGATPYGFYFITKERTDEELDSHIVERSPMYFLGGTVLTLTALKKRNAPGDSTLISNMECNDWDQVVENRNSWLWVQPLNDDDVILDYEPRRIA